MPQKLSMITRLVTPRVIQQQLQATLRMTGGGYRKVTPRCSHSTALGSKEKAHESTKETFWLNLSFLFSVAESEGD